MREEVEPLLDRFLTGLREVLPPTAVWVHGSLALGDFQPGRSDIDAIAVVESAPTTDQRRQLKVLHQALAAVFPQAKKLHCSYVVRDTLPDPRVRHLTWAHEELLTRPVTEVTRRELHTGDLTLYGPPPSELLPPVGDEELAAFIRADLRDFWLPATAKPVRWLQDVWVDLGLLTLGRATRHPHRRPPAHQGRGARRAPGARRPRRRPRRHPRPPLRLPCAPVLPPPRPPRPRDPHLRPCGHQAHPGGRLTARHDGSGRAPDQPGRASTCRVTQPSASTSK